VSIKYLSFTDRAAALKRSAEIALANGCGRCDGDVTTHWFSARPAASGVAVAFVVPDDHAVLLTADERTRLIDAWSNPVIGASGA